MTGVSDPSTRFVPEGNVPKVYFVLCENASDWNEIHNYIINENELDGIPNRKISCVDPYKTSNRMASYEMLDAEAEQLKNHPKVIEVDFDKGYYQGTYDDSIYTINSKTDRYSSNIKVHRANFGSSTVSQEAWMSYALGGALGRHQDKLDPWDDVSINTVFNTIPQYYGDGTGVDVIVNDTAAWLGHIEFVKTGVGEPTHYNGTNVLKSGFATSATTGVCDVLDVILHAPYYIDPDWFEADPTNRLEKRWDGTTVPVGSVARSWWNTETCKVTWNMKVTDKDNSANYKILSITNNVGQSFTRYEFSYSETSSGGTLSNGEVYVEFSSPELGTSATRTFTYDLVSSSLTSNSGEMNFYDSDTIYINGNAKGGTNASVFLGMNVRPVIGTRSPKYVSTNIPGGTATIGSIEDFGTISISSSYTELVSNGINTQINTGLYIDDAISSHGTKCMSQAYGKTQGWAFNSNKWFIAKWSAGAPNVPNYFKFVKVFHQLKPNNPTHSTKDPTVASHSWGFAKTFSHGDYAYFRTDGDGTGGEEIEFQDQGASTNRIETPKWLGYFHKGNTLYYQKKVTDVEHTTGVEVVDAGVIFFAASGNNNQKMVLDGHPDYNNYVSSNSSRTLADAKTYELLSNRPSFPASVGLVENYNNSGTDKYRSFNIGSLNTYKVSNTQEKKSDYSNMGEGIDCYAIGKGSLSASNIPLQGYGGSPRYDGYYRIDSNYNIVTSGGTLSAQSYSATFEGTSSACPVSAGLVATKLGLNRNWTWVDIKNWFETDVTDQTASAFYSGTEATTASDSNWDSVINLQGGSRKIIWDAQVTQTSESEPEPAVVYTITGPLDITGTLNVTT